MAPTEPRGYITPEAIEQVLARAGGTFSGDLQAASEELGRLYNTQLATRDALLDELSRRIDSVERERTTLAARLKAGEGEAGSDRDRAGFVGIGDMDWRRWQVWLTQLFVAMLLGLGIVGVGDYIIRYDDIPLLPDARGPISATAVTTVLPTSVSAAGPVTPEPATASSLGTPALTPAPAATPTVQIATPEIVSNVALAPRTLLQQAARAEAALKTGQFEARVDYGRGAHSTVEMRFDLGGGNRVPRVDMTTIYTNSTETEAIRHITVSGQTWQRRQGKDWVLVAEEVGVSGEIQDYLVHADAVASAESDRNLNPFELHWYDASRNADVTLVVDSITGVPRRLRRVARDTGWILTVSYKGWNTPVSITPPPK
jgi:hypothetical protein